MRVLARLTLAAALGLGLAACGGGDGGGGDGGGGGGAGAGDTTAPGTSQDTATTTTTRTTPVPGPAGSEVDIPAAVAERWTELGGEQSDLGRVTGPATAIGGGSVTDFERGAIVLTPSGRALVVQGEILTAYREAGGPGGDLGFPTADETATDGGWISTFEGGVITYLDGVTEVEAR